MSNIDLFTMALRNMTKRKLRSFLTILGVVVGSASIIVMISLGIATNINFEQSLVGMGDLTVINVMSAGGGGGGGGMMYSSNDSSSSSLNYEAQLDEKAVNGFRRLENVVAATPILEFYITGISGKFIINARIKGIDPASMEAFGYKLAEGKLLGEGENLTAVFGKQIAYDFYNPKDRNWWQKMYSKGYENREPVINPMTDKVEITFDDSFLYTDDNPLINEEDKKPRAKPYKINVVGVLEEGGYENDYSIYMNIKEVEKIKKAKEKFETSRYGGQSNRAKAGVFDKVVVKCKDINAVETVSKEIEKLGFYADNPFKYINEMKETMASLQFLLGAVGGVAFFVAAIGIANTMIMAIYERTKEIGIMKVIGATVRDVKRLFLLEASLIGLIGGGLGVLLSYGLSYVINKFGISFLGNMGGEGSKVSVIPPWLAIVALAFAATIGLLSGYFPARRAVKLNALTAIKSE